MRVLVTGAAGFVGRRLVAALAADGDRFERVLALDLQAARDCDETPHVTHRTGDVRDPALAELLRNERVAAVVHLAAVVTPRPGMTRDTMYSIDVLGTKNVVDACLEAGVRQLVVTSSGAAYGYYADNPRPLFEDHPVRGNEAFAYSCHKRMVEEMLARYRHDQPELGQLVFRAGTILGHGVANQITALFDKPVVLGISGSDVPFVFVWVDDVVGAIVKGLVENRTGVFNLAGDGVVTLKDVARRIGKPYFPLPASLIAGALTVLHPLGLTQYGSEQVDFLRYRPVLANEKLKSEFGYEPRYTSHQAFEEFWKGRLHG